ncbi:MAG: hypothetical protein HRT47_01825 [Candidatus Caenarcaniphilales bacterium]|nr:hypothetical protein [Candidatus Caenarcaniphilales bacterium]
MLVKPNSAFEYLFIFKNLKNANIHIQVLEPLSKRTKNKSIISEFSLKVIFIQISKLIRLSEILPAERLKKINLTVIIIFKYPSASSFATY